MSQVPQGSRAKDGEGSAHNSLAGCPLEGLLALERVQRTHASR